MTNSLVDTLSQLPPHSGITYRGLSGPAPQSATTVAAVMPTSADPRVASENFTTERLAAIVTVTGRLIAPMSRHPDEQEIAILPGTLLLSVGSVAVPGLTNDVELLAETGTAPGLPADLAELIQVVTQHVTAALSRPSVTVHSPGRFSPPRNPRYDAIDNATVRRVVAEFAAEPNQRRALEVLRTCMYGELLFDITGSDEPVHGTFPKGSRLQIRSGSGPDGGRALFAFTSNDQIARMNPPGTQTQSLVTPATGALELARSNGDAWLYIDPAGPTCALSAAEIDFALRNPHNEALKSALADHEAGLVDRQSAIRLLRQDAPLALAADDRSVPGKIGIRSMTMPDGSSALLAFTSAPEVVAYNASDAVTVTTTLKVLETVRKDGYSGIVVNPAGPSIAVPVWELAAT